MSPSQLIQLGEYTLYYDKCEIEVKERKCITAFLNGTCIAYIKLDSYCVVRDLIKIMNKIDNHFK